MKRSGLHPTVNNKRIELAKEFAKKKHAFQLRKDEKTMYWAHLEQVVHNLISMGIKNNDILCAGWLHDTIEDTNTDFDDLADNFGENVARIVTQVTKDKRKPEVQRERDYQAQLEAASWQAQVVKLGDIWANLADLDSGYKVEREKVNQVRKKLRYFDAIKFGLLQNASKIAHLDMGIDGINRIISRFNGIGPISLT